MDANMLADCAWGAVSELEEDCVDTAGLIAAVSLSS